LPVFEMIGRLGSMHRDEMFRTLNMGIGMVWIVDQEQVNELVSCLKEAGFPAYQIGEVVAGTKEVVLKPSC
jgi:phosphoribosylformylglycinamidine cyclo-ligase